MGKFYAYLRPLLLGLLLVLLSMSANACDYTVRDIGFVPHSAPRYTLVVMSPTAVAVDDETKQLCSKWGLATLSVGPTTGSELPERIRQHHAGNPVSVSVWLIDSDRRCLHLADIQDVSTTLSLVSLIDERFNTPATRRLRSAATTTFAQILLFDAADSFEEEAGQAAAALKELEPMLPRPITLPAEVVVVSPQERESESLLMWALGIDSAVNGKAVLAVLYGRGRLAGPALVGGAISHPAMVAQLALVGESCECETDRAWLAERTIPFYWDREDDRHAKGLLGFDPGNKQVQDDVQRVIARGKRLNATGRPDTIERIVASYMESQVEGYTPRRLQVPDGASSNQNISSTVIQGDGWGFDQPELDANAPPTEAQSSTTKNATADELDMVVFGPDISGKAPVQHTVSPPSSFTPAILSIFALAALAISIAIWKQFS